MSKPTKSPADRRRRRFIFPELQIRIVLQVLFVTLPILFLNFLLVFSDIWSLQGTEGSPGYTVIQGMSRAVFVDLVIALVIAVPFGLSAGITYSFRYCGPLYKMRRYFDELVHGRWDRRCTLRQGDYLQDMKDDLNRAFRLVAHRVHRQHVLLGEIEGFLENSHESLKDSEQFEALCQKIAVERAEVAGRFGEDTAFDDVTEPNETQREEAVTA